MTVTTVPAVEIADGVDIPQIGFGLFKVDPDQAQAVTEEALAAGYRHLDTAAIYRNEHAVGAAIAASGIPRDELFVTTKVWNDAHGRQRTRDAFERSRDALGVEVVDLYLVHWPVPTAHLYRETWRALQELHGEGAVRAIGVSNFLTEHLDDIADLGGVQPAVNQIEVHPTNQETDLIRRCHAAGIVIEAYSPLARGRAVDLPALTETARRHDRTTSQVILNWHVRQGRIVLPKTVTASRMRENIEVFDLALTDEELAAIDALDVADRIGADPRTFTGA